MLVSGTKCYKTLTKEEKEQYLYPVISYFASLRIRVVACGLRVKTCRLRLELAGQSPTDTLYSVRLRAFLQYEDRSTFQKEAKLRYALHMRTCLSFLFGLQEMMETRTHGRGGVRDGKR